MILHSKNSGFESHVGKKMEVHIMEKEWMLTGSSSFQHLLSCMYEVVLKKEKILKEASKIMIRAFLQSLKRITEY
jgi:hypothetical protein